MAAKKPAAAPTAIELPQLDIRTVEIPLIGDTPLICHAWSEKARKLMADKQQKKASAGREAKNPRDDFLGSLYWASPPPDNPTEADLKAATFGFPAIAFKAAAVDACTSIATMTKVSARQAFHIDGELVALRGGPPIMREDIARVGMGVADLRYRGEFTKWGAVLRVKLNASVLSESQLVGLFDLAGFAVGVGDWRPQRGGPYGRFHVAKTKEKLP